MIELPRSTFYYRTHSRDKKLKQDTDLRDRIKAIVFDFPGYGYRRVTHALYRQGIRVNHKRILRVMHQGRSALPQETAILHHYRQHTFLPYVLGN